MKPMALNMSKVKKIASDKASSTFEHEDGHTIKILHKALPAIQRRQIEKMPMCEGGKVKLAEGGEAKKPTPKKPAIRPDKGFGKTIVYPHSEEMQHFDDGGTVVAKPTGDTQAPPVQDSSAYDQTLSNGWSNIKKAFSGNSKAEGGEIQHYDTGTASVQPATPAPDAEPDSTPAPQPQVDPAHVVSGQSPEQIATQIANQQTPAVQSAQPTNTGQSMYGDKTLNPSANLDLENKAVSQQAEVDKAKGAALANAQDGYGKAFAANLQRDRDHLNQMTQYVKEFDAYNKEHPIDQTHYVSDMGAAKKTGTAIALLLGGIGSGLVGGSNPAQDFLDRQIDRDIEGQKARADQQKTIYGAYMKLYNDQNIASDLTKASLLGIQTNQINKISSQLATPQASAIAAAQTAKNNAAAQQALLDAAGRRNTLGTGGSGPANLNQQPGTNQPTGRVSQPGKGASASSIPEKKGYDYEADHILKPGANASFVRNQYDSRYKEDGPEVKEQLEKASAADAAIDAVNHHFPAMYANVKRNAYESANPNDPTGMSQLATKGANKLADAMSYVHKKGENLEGVPYVGPAIAGAAKAATDTQANREYDVHRDAMLSAVTSALSKSGMTPTDAHSAAIDMLPVEGDTPAMARLKIETAKEKIRTAANPNALKRHGLTRDTKK